MKTAGIVVHHHPKGRQLPALEKNILKYRALEMVIILFYSENLNEFVINSIRTTDRHSLSEKPRKDRLPDGTSKLNKKAWKILVDDKILTQEENEKIESLIGYRNDIGHRIHQLVADVSRDAFIRDHAQLAAAKYDYNVRKQLKHFAREIPNRLARKYISEFSLDEMFFDSAERTYEEELARLDRKIRRQFARREKEIEKLNTELSLKELGLVGEFDPSFPANRAQNKTLTSRGVEICYRLFDSGKSTLAVAHLMRLSYRAAFYRRRAWERAGGRRRKKATLHSLLLK